MFVISMGVLGDEDYLSVVGAGDVVWQKFLGDALWFGRVVDAEAYVSAHVRGLMSVDEYRVVEVEA